MKKWTEEHYCFQKKTKRLKPNMNSQPNPKINRQAQQLYWTELISTCLQNHLSMRDITQILKTFDTNEDLTPEAFKYILFYMSNIIKDVLSFSLRMASKRGQQSFDPEDIEYAIGLFSEQYIESLKRNERNQSSQISQSESQNFFTEPINESQQEHQNTLEMLSEFRKSKIEEMTAKLRSKFENKYM